MKPPRPGSEEGSRAGSLHIGGRAAMARGGSRPARRGFPSSSGRAMVGTMKLLVIEDDREAAAYIAKGLGESGYVVDQAHEGRDALFLATGGTYDALIVDRMLPGMDGLAVISALRAAEIKTPVLILTAPSALRMRT